MTNNEDKLKKIIGHAKEYGFVFQSSEIYDGLSAVYDYAQNGVELKKNIRDYWWKAMVQMHENIVGIDAAIFMHPTTWSPWAVAVLACKWGDGLIRRSTPLKICRV